MSATGQNSNGTTSITSEQFDALYNCGRAPHDIFEEKGTLGVAFNVEGRGQVRVWQIEGQGCFLEGGMDFKAAQKILAP